MRNPKSYLQVITPATALPITLTTVKDHLGITDSASDTRLTGYLWAALDHVEAETGNVYCEQTYLLNMNGFPTMFNFMNANVLYWNDYYPWYSLLQRRDIVLPMPPLDGDSVGIQYYDANNALQTWATDQYYVSAPATAEGWITPVTDYPAAYDRPDSVQITFTTSADQIPYRLDIVVLAIVSMMNENREGQWEWSGIDRIIDNLKGSRYV